MRPAHRATCWSPSSSAVAWVRLAACGRTWEIGHVPRAERMTSLYTTFSRGTPLLKLVDALVSFAQSATGMAVGPLTHRYS